MAQPVEEPPEEREELQELWSANRVLAAVATAAVAGVALAGSVGWWGLGLGVVVAVAGFFVDFAFAAKPSPIDAARDRVTEAAKVVTTATPVDTTPPASAEPPSPAGPTDRLIAALAELAVAQNRPKRDPVLRTWFLPIMLALIAIGPTVVSLIREATSDDEVDCGAYVTVVLSIGGDDATSDTLDTLVDRLDFGKESKHCGVTPRQILEGAGKIT